MRFNIVTPVLNGEEFLNETILSVVSQAGHFSIRYHVQDGGSTDATIKILTTWQNCLANGFPISCEGIEFSFASEPDRGLYDAVRRGFAACGDADVMTWINADDRFEPGAFATVSKLFNSNLDVDWVTGRPTVIAEGGEILHMSPIVPFPRKAIAAGIFDGRFARPFIQQEGTFWRPELWTQVGGINSDYRVAGDFDLWRRFAIQKDLVIVDAILGCFRMRSGQLSADVKQYHAEIDSTLSPDEMRIRAKVAKRYAHAGFEYKVVLRHYAGSWVCERWPMCVFPFLGTKAFKAEHWRLSLMACLTGESS